MLGKAERADATPPSAEPEVGDGELLRRIVARRDDALATLYDRHAPQLLSLAHRILGDWEDAEEVLQEVFVYVWDHAQSYDAGRSSLSTWLVLITRSRAIDRLRSVRVLDRVLAHLEVEQVLERHTSPEAASTVLVKERQDRVRRELDHLPPEQREVLQMAFFGGLSQTEIAAATGTPLGTVKTRTLLAMKKLRTALRAEIQDLL